MIWKKLFIIKIIRENKQWLLPLLCHFFGFSFRIFSRLLTFFWFILDAFLFSVSRFRSLAAHGQVFWRWKWNLTHFRCWGAFDASRNNRSFSSDLFLQLVVVKRQARLVVLEFLLLESCLRGWIDREILWHHQAKLNFIIFRANSLYLLLYLFVCFVKFNEKFVERIPDSSFAQVVFVLFSTGCSFFSVHFFLFSKGSY